MKPIDIEALDTEFYSTDLETTLTIRDYLITLLRTLWHEKEGFSGKRPFGNSGWEYDLAAPLIQHGYLDGKVFKEDEDDEYMEATDYDAGIYDDLVEELIEMI